MCFCGERGSSVVTESDNFQQCPTLYESKAMNQDGWGDGPAFERGFNLYLQCQRESGHDGPHACHRVEHLSFTWGEGADNG